MTHDDFAKRRKEFKPEARPEWLSRVNQEGSCMDIRSLVPLDENSLIETARANTGLSDFGDDGWHERFQILVKALDEEAGLNLMGRLLTRTDLLMNLQARLQVEEVYRLHPEIADEQIREPIFIVGQGRSGTSFLQNLLSADPQNGTTRTWEVLEPVPPPQAASYLSDPRIERLRYFADQINRVTPEMQGLHEFSVDIPTESHHLLCMAFGSVGWISAFYGQVASYCAYMSRQSMVPVYQYQAKVMKLLQWKNPRQRWVMKSPLCLPDLREIREVHPDVAFVWPHRDPVKALASMISMVGTLQWGRSDHPFKDGDMLEALTTADANATLMEMPIGWLESGEVPRAQLFNLQYTEFLDAPMRVVADLYAHFGFEMPAASRRAMQQYLDDNPRSSRPAHRYPTVSHNLDAERRAYQRYQSYFGVGNEV